MFSEGSFQMFGFDIMTFFFFYFTYVDPFQVLN